MTSADLFCPLQQFNVRRFCPYPPLICRWVPSFVLRLPEALYPTEMLWTRTNITFQMLRLHLWTKGIFDSMALILTQPQFVIIRMMSRFKIEVQVSVLLCRRWRGPQVSGVQLGHGRQLCLGHCFRYLQERVCWYTHKNWEAWHLLMSLRVRAVRVSPISLLYRWDGM